MMDMTKIFYARMIVESRRAAVRRCQIANRSKYASTKKATDRKRYLANRDRVARYQSEYRKKNRERIKLRDKAYVSSHRDETRGYARKFYRENTEKCLAATADWGKRHPEKRREHAKRYRQHPHVRCHMRVVKSLKSAFGLGRSFRKWEGILGYSAIDLKKHIESLFTDGMTWKAFMRGEIHIDHIKPKSKFKFTSEHDTEFKKCWALTNLQPLWALDNIRKGAKYELTGGATT